MNTRKDMIHVRISASERKALERMADAEGRNKSQMLRELIRRSAKSRGIDYTTLTGKESQPR